VVPRQPSLWFRPGQRHVVALAGSWPSASTRCFGTMKSEMPRVPGTSWPSGAGILASTRWTMFSVSSWSPAEIHILLPVQPVARAQRVVGVLRAIGHGAGQRCRQARAGLRLATGTWCPEAPANSLLRKDLLAACAVPCAISRLALPVVSMARADADRGQAENALAAGLHRVGQLHAANARSLARR